MRLSYRGVAKCHLNHGKVPYWDPTLSDKCLPPNIVVEKIHRLIDSLLLADDILPPSQVLSDSQQLAASVETCVI